MQIQQQKHKTFTANIKKQLVAFSLLFSAKIILKSIYWCFFFLKILNLLNLIDDCNQSALG